jgi:predicted transcriptional regulator
MKISDLASSLGLTLVQGNFKDRTVSAGYTSDLLSDVMANAAADGVLITVQAHKNTIAVAALVGLAAVVICNGRPVPADMIEAAKTEGIALFKTTANAFEVSGWLWSAMKGA